MENWRRYLNGDDSASGGDFGGGGSSDSWGDDGAQSDSILEHNIKFLLDQNHPVKHKGKFYDDPITDIWWDFEPFKEPIRENAEKAFRNITVLSRIKIKSHLGTGDNGIAFLMENNTVFKIFMDDEKSTDFSWYNALKGSSRPEDIEIYSFEKIPSEASKGDLAWVNMELTTPITSLYDPNDIAYDIDDLRFKLFLFVKPDSPTTQMWKDHPMYDTLKSTWDNLDNNIQRASFLLNRATDISRQKVPFSRNTLDDKQSFQFVIDLLNFIENHGLQFTGDIHSGNFGLAKNNHYKIFDISGEAPTK